MENEKLKELIAMHDLLAKHAPTAALLDYIKRPDEYIVLYREDSNICTPYIIHHLNDSGLYYGHYYSNGWLAWNDFAKMR